MQHFVTVDFDNDYKKMYDHNGEQQQFRDLCANPFLAAKNKLVSTTTETTFSRTLNKDALEIDVDAGINKSVSVVETGMNESENDGVHDKKYDIGQMIKGDVEIIGKKVAELDDTLKYRILCQHEVHDENFKFPTKYLHGRNRKCQKSYIYTALLFIKRKMIPFGAYHVLFLYPTRKEVHLASL